jgi:cell division septum initiation protein DivIVA
MKKELLQIIDDIKTNLSTVQQGVSLLRDRIEEIDRETEESEEDEKDIWDDSTPYFDVLGTFLKSFNELFGSSTKKEKKRED